MTKNKKQAIIGIIAVIALLGVAIGCWVAFGPKGTQGMKTIEVTVVSPDATTTHTVKTDAEFLGEALLDEKLIEGDSGEFGLFITTVNGVTANDANQEWWCITKGGEDVMTGADMTPIVDGDKFEITLMEGY